MSFFDDLPPPPPPPQLAEPETLPWMAPPAGWVGGWVPWHLVVMRNPNVYAVATEFQAFPNGVLFTLGIRIRPSALPASPGWPDPPLMLSMGTTDGPVLGIGFADGRKTAFHRPFPEPGREPEAPVLSTCGGSGGHGQEQLSVWLWPLPPEGPLTLAAAWPALDVEETETTVDAGELVAAATRAEELWPGEPPAGWGGVSTIEIRRPHPGTS